MQDLWQDLRYGARRLLRSPGFTAIAVLTLAMGIGATSAVFALVNAVLLRALPFEQPDRLVVLNGLMRRETVEDWPISYLDLGDLAARDDVLAGVAGLGDPLSLNLSTADEVEHVTAEMVSAGYFRLLGVEPVLGRTFLPQEDTPPAPPPAVVLSHGLWQRRFGADRGVLDRVLHLNEQPYTIVGVMPPGFRGTTDKADLWVAAATAGPTLGPHYLEMRRFRWLSGLARLQPGVSVAQAQQVMDAVTTRLEQEHPESNQGWSVRLTPLAESWFGALRPRLLALLGAAGFVLLIACTNVASLVLARGTARGKEMSVRAALGAGRLRLVRQLVVESLLLALLGCGLGLLLAHWAARFAATRSGLSLQSFLDVGVDWTVVGVIVAVSVLSALLFGLAPALLASRADLQGSLREGGQATTGGSGRRLFQGALVVAEVAIALCLLVGAGLMIKGFRHLMATDLGFRTEGLLTLRADLSGQRWADNLVYATLAGELLDRVATVAGVESVALEGPGLPTSEWHGATFTVQELMGSPSQGAVAVLRHHVSPGYFKTLGIPLLAGRDFTRDDGFQSPAVVIVSKTMADRSWPGEEAVGKLVKPGGADSPAPWFTVIGVVGDVDHRGLSGEEVGDPDIYLTVFQSPPRSPTTLALLVRGSVPPAALAAPVQEAVAEVAPTLALYEVETMTDRLERQTAQGRFLVLLMSAFAVVALVLAAVGVFGILSYTVAQRAREIGIRMALGARRGDAVGLVVRGGVLLVLAGVAIGLISAFLLNRFLTSLLHGVSPTDPMTLAATSLLLVAVAALASWLPARRATRVEPVTALRSE